MTPKQIDRVRKTIADIKRTLAAEKRKFGCYDDGRGLRYLPPGLFIQLSDYSGGKTYLKWFAKNFPDDIGFPIFLFEWTIILFKCGKLKEAESKAMQTYYSNTYMFDRFLNHPIIPLDKHESSNWETPSLASRLPYSCYDEELKDFGLWLVGFTASERFIEFKQKHIEINTRLKNETDEETRHYLVMQNIQLRESI